MPQLLYFASIQPILFVLLFPYAFGGAIATPASRSYVNYLLPGLVREATIVRRHHRGRARHGPVRRARRPVPLPAHRPPRRPGRPHPADLCRTPSSWPSSWPSAPRRLPVQQRRPAGAAAIGLALAFAYAYSWLLAIIGLAVKDAETAQLAGTLPILIFIFASSLAVPVGTMPGWLQAFARNQPVSVTMNAVRALTQGGPAAHWAWQSLAWTAGLIIVLIPAATALYRRR